MIKYKLYKSVEAFLVYKTTVLPKGGWASTIYLIEPNTQCLYVGETLTLQHNGNTSWSRIHTPTFLSKNGIFYCIESLEQIAQRNYFEDYFVKTTNPIGFSVNCF